MEVLARLEIDLLGGFHVRVGSRSLPDSVWRLSKARSLLKLLALAPGHRLARERVLDLLWPDLPPEAAVNNLYQTLHAVRRALRTEGGAGEVRLQHGLLLLQPDGTLCIDVDVFEVAAGRARMSDDPKLYHAAITLYTGELLPDDQYEDWAVERREHTGVITTLNNLGAIAVERGRCERARSLLEESLSLARELGAKRSASVALINLGHVNRQQRRTPEAVRCYREGLLLAREQGEKATMAMNLEGLAASFAVIRHTALAVTLFSAADGLRRSVGVPLIPAEASEYETILDTARQELGEEFEPAWATGRSTSIDAILVLALEQPVAGV